MKTNKFKEEIKEIQKKKNKECKNVKGVKFWKKFFESKLIFL